MTRLYLPLGMGAAILVLGALLLDARSDAAALQAELTACNQANAAMADAARETAVEEGTRRENSEAASLADCERAYDAGRGDVSDTDAITAGRYVPGSRAGRPAG